MERFGTGYIGWLAGSVDDPQSAQPTRMRVDETAVRINRELPDGNHRRVE
jgi:hypothetical protein